MKNNVLCILFAALLIPGCATVKRSLVTGAVAGAAAGTVTGAAVSPTDKKRNSATGAAVGAVLGAAAAWFFHGELEKRDEKTRREVLFNLENFDVRIPREQDGGAEK